MFKSSDQGVTWQPLLTFNTTTEIDLVYVNHLNYIFTSPTPGSTNELGIWRSTNGGTQWAHVLSLPSGCNIWSMTEDSSGNLFAGVYTSGSPLADARIYKSTDGGATWTSVYYDSVARHVHCVYIDPTDNYIYASVGDAIPPWSTNYLLRSTDDGNTWSKILSGMPQIVAITSVSGARLFATDQSSPIDGQIYRTTDDTSYSRVYDVGAPAYGFWLRTNSLNGYVYASFVSNEISKTAGIVCKHQQRRNLDNLQDVYCPNRRLLWLSNCKQFRARHNVLQRHVKQRLPKRHRNLSSLRHIEHSGKCPPPCRSAFTIKRCHTSTNTFTFKLRWPHNSFSHWILQNPKTIKIHFCHRQSADPLYFLFEKLLNP